MPHIVFDNGGANLRVGFSNERKPRILPNYSAKGKSDRKAYVGDELDNCIEIASLTYRRPVERGYVVNWELQGELWDRALGPAVLNVRSAAEHSLTLTEAPFAPLPLRQLTWEMAFEEYRFQSLCVATPAYFAAVAANKTDCSLIIDSGYSFTHVTPVFNGVPVAAGIRRINVGGKVLTNFLKEIVSFRYWNMMEETLLMNIIKERCCYVSQDFIGDMQAMARGSLDIRREYVLPDYTTTHRGHIKGYESPPPAPITPVGVAPAQREEQVLPMHNERITVPEALFQPSDVGIRQAGIAEAVFQSLEAVRADIRPLFLANVVVTGGCALFPGFQERLQRELRAGGPAEATVQLTPAKDPLSLAWEGGAVVANAIIPSRLAVSRAEWLERGAEVCLQRFTV
jgi:actin-related protein 6